MDGTIKNSKLIFYKTESSQNLVELINIKIQGWLYSKVRNKAIFFTNVSWQKQVIN